MNENNDFFYGWVMVPVATLAFIVTSGAQTYGVSLFNASFRHELGISHSQLTGAYMLGTFLGSLPMGYVGFIMDKYGLRLTTAIVVFLMGLTCILMSQVQGLFNLTLGFFMLRMLGPGALAMLAGAILPFWFSRRLGLVEGIRHVGIAAGMAVVPTLILYLIQGTGWRWAYAVIGFSVWAVMLPVMAFIFKNRPEEIGQQIDGQKGSSGGNPGRLQREGKELSFSFRQAISTRAFWISAVAFGLWAMINTAVQFNIVPLLETRGMGEPEAALMFRIYALTLAIMYLPGGCLADRFPLNLLTSVALAALTAALAVLIVLKTETGVYCLAILLGTSQALLIPVLTTMLPRYYGLLSLGKIRGTLSTILVAFSSLGPFLIGVFFDVFGSYSQVLYLLFFMPMPMIFISLFADAPDHPENAVHAESK